MEKITVFIKWALIVAVVIIASSVSVKLWSIKSESTKHSVNIVYEKDMTVLEFGKKNNLANPVLKKIFKLETKKDLEKN